MRIVSPVVLLILLIWSLPITANAQLSQAMIKVDGNIIFGNCDDVPKVDCEYPILILIAKYSDFFGEKFFTPPDIRRAFPSHFLKSIESKLGTKGELECRLDALWQDMRRSIALTKELPGSSMFEQQLTDYSHPCLFLSSPGTSGRQLLYWNRGEIVAWVDCYKIELSEETCKVNYSFDELGENFSANRIYWSIETSNVSVDSVKKLIKRIEYIPSKYMESLNLDQRNALRKSGLVSRMDIVKSH